MRDWLRAETLVANCFLCLVIFAGVLSVLGVLLQVAA